MGLIILRHRVFRWPTRACLVLCGLLAVFGLGQTSCAVYGSKQVSGYSLPRAVSVDQLTLLSWNVQKASHPDLATDLKAAIEAHDPDLLFLQEAQPGRILNRHVAGILAPAWELPWGRKGAVGVFTASRNQPQEWNAIRSRDREFGVTVPKAALVTHHVLDAEQTLLAVNVHALNFEAGKPEAFTRQLNGIRDLLVNHDGPMILAGDFNTWNSIRDERLRTLTDSLGLREVGPFAGQRKTGDQGSPFLNDVLGIDPDLPLDRVFYRGLAVDAARVLDLHSSDHQPLLVTFRRNDDLRGA